MITGVCMYARLYDISDVLEISFDSEYSETYHYIFITDKAYTLCRFSLQLFKQEPEV